MDLTQFCEIPNSILPVSPPISPRKKKDELFYADEKMINFLNNDDICGYLLYIKNKRHFEKYGTNPYLEEATKIIDEEVKLRLYQERKKEELEAEEKLRIKIENNKKKQMMDDIFISIENLESTLKNYNKKY